MLLFVFHKDKHSLIMTSLDQSILFMHFLLQEKGNLKGSYLTPVPVMYFQGSQVQMKTQAVYICVNI